MKTSEQKAAYMRNWRAENRMTPEQKARHSEYNKKNRADKPLTLEQKSRKAECRRKWRANNPAKYAAYSRNFNYGLADEQFQKMLAFQEGRCLICKVLFIDTPCVDHCHTTKKVRGLLCRKCNAALGLLNEDFSTVIRAANHLRKHASLN